MRTVNATVFVLRPYRRHFVGVAFVLAALLLVFVMPRTDGHGSVRQVADLASGKGNTFYLSLGILTLLSLAYAARSKDDFKRVAVVMLVETVVVQASQKIGFYCFGWWPRPSGHDGGFPSGHAAAACALAYLLTERLPRLAPLWYAVAALISWSRVEAGAHYPYQVVGGAILGLTVAIVFHRRFAPKTEAENAPVKETN